MSIIAASTHQPIRSRRHERRAERRRLQRIDMLSGRLAELHAMRALLEQAAAATGRGWIQDAWFTVDLAAGKRRVTAFEVGLAENQPVTDACLVGSVVQAAGGPSTVRSQRVQRTLDLVWHTLREEPDQGVRWCPGPDVRAMHLLDLTHWNDAPGRTQGEVADLLLAARQTADVERGNCRAELAELGSTHVAPR
jgi:hypothetical protein